MGKGLQVIILCQRGLTDTKVWESSHKQISINYENSNEMDKDFQV